MNLSSTLPNNLTPSRVLKAASIDPVTIAKMVGVETLTLEEVWDDLQKVASSVASMYTDHTCFALSYEDLYAECMKKVVHVVEKGYLKKSRSEFFKIVKTAMNNHVRGIVQRHRFTIKRTGHRPPARDDVNATNTKPEISIDDPDNGIQVSGLVDGSAEYDDELIEDLKIFLTPAETMVLDQLRAPNSASFMHAYMEASTGRRRRDDLSVKVTHASMAYGLGLNLDEFSALEASIRKKYMANIMTDNQEDTKYNVALATLENVYGVQVPRSTEKIVVARLFTICARDQLEKLTPELEKVLLAVGAKPPVIGDGRLACFGVLFQKNNRVCHSCGLNQACQVEAANYGLGEISISPKLLGSRSSRFPTFTDNPPSSMSTTDQQESLEKPDAQSQTTSNPVLKPEPKTQDQKDPFTHTERDEIILNHLKERYKAIKFGTDIYYTHKGGKNTCVFYAGKEGEKFDIRICKPSDELKQLLVKKVRSYYLPDDITVEKALEIIDRHGNLTFELINKKETSTE